MHELMQLNFFIVHESTLTSSSNRATSLLMHCYISGGQKNEEVCFRKHQFSEENFDISKPENLSNRRIFS